MSSLPPPHPLPSTQDPDPPPRWKRAWTWLTASTFRIAATLTAAVIVAMIVNAVVTSSQDTGDDDPSRTLTPVEAACTMLGDGETEQFTYEVMVDVLRDESYRFPDPEAAAREAVDQAVEQGC